MSRRGNDRGGGGRGFGRGRRSEDMNDYLLDNDNRVSSGPEKGTHQEAQQNGALRQEPVPLKNFFGFSHKEMPNIPTPPERMSTQYPVTRVARDWDMNRESDDNTDYVEHYKNLSDAHVEKLSRLKVTEENASRTKRRSNDEASVFGTMPAENRAGSDDPEVFWKYDMKKRHVDTSHLMINKSKEKFLSTLHSRQVVIVEGFTGCGKTTQVPQFILDDAAENSSRCKIVVTQPRRIAAISVASRVCQERGWQLGSLVGYQVGMDRKLSEDTRLVYVTTGVLLQMLIGKKSLTDYTHIIIDEVHERDLDTDLLLLVLKKLIVDRADNETKILLMSATLNATKFMGYFPSWGNDELSSAAVIRVTQPSLHKITEHHLETLAGEYGFEGFTVEGGEEPRIFQECNDIACKIIEGLDFFEFSDEKFAGQATEEEKQQFSLENVLSGKLTDRGAVLVFLPGLMEIDTLFKQLSDISTAKAGSNQRPDLVKWTILPLHSSITSEEQQKVFLPARPGYRKIILATNIAESSITVPDIKYVIDFCLTKSLSCDPATNYTCLRMEWASKNQCIQRRGRCGRVAAGHVFRMVPEAFFNALDQDALPEMEKASLEAVVLHVKILDMGSPVEVLALAVDPPKKSGIGRAVANLKEAGALTLKADGIYQKYDGDLTYMGQVMSRLPIDIRFGRLIMLGLVYGVLDDAIVIAAGLSTKSPFSYPFAKRLEAYLSKLGWAVRTYSDCFALLNAFSAWTERHRAHDFRSFSEEKNWARTYYLQLSVLREIGALVDEIKRRLKGAGIEAGPIKLSTMERGLILKLVIAGAFYPNYFVRPRPNKKEYEREIVRDVGGFNPLNSVVYQGFPIEQPGKLYAKHIAAVLTNHQSIPHVQFNASKVIVTFDPRGDKIGPISHGVYSALKMRMLRQKLTFFTHGREEAVKELARAMEKLDSLPILSVPAVAALPSIRQKEFQCYVTHVDSPGEFWVVRSEDEVVLASINEILQDTKETLIPSRRDDVQVGCMCIAIKSNTRYRARIECLRNNGEALLYLIDHGISLWRTSNQIYSLSEFMFRYGMHKKAALAMQCRLSEVKAATRQGCNWYQESSREFSDFIVAADNQFVMRIYSVVDSVISGELYCPKLHESANERMLKMQFADKTTESRASIENNDARRLWRALNYDEHQIMAHDRRQISEWEPQRMVDPPRLNSDTGCLVSLRGPSSPLEMSFTSLCRSAHLKMVQIEGNSVNCVALDQEPFSACSRLLIASNVGIAHRSGNIMARETTMMPAIPGLVSLLAMVFCPKLEFRLDDLQTRYTGCVSGLGVDPIDGVPVYPDHDMELIFDTFIDNVDIHNVNAVRATMNMLMREGANQHEVSENLREQARDEIIKLLQRERDPVDEVWPEMTHIWTVVDEEKVMPGMGQARGDIDVFPLHTAIRLNSAGEGLEPLPPRNVFQCGSVLGDINY